LFVIGGDFNARVGDNPDYIEGTDSVQPREIIDYATNTLGDNLLDFLIKTNCLIVNGRVPGVNNFTSTNSHGFSVVEYILVPSEQIVRYRDFKVFDCNDLVENYKVLPVGNNKPDHSLLAVTLDNIPLKSKYTRNKKTLVKTYKTKFDLHNVPDDFFNDPEVLYNLHGAIEHLENSQTTQNNLDEVYIDFADSVLEQMNKRLPKHTICLNDDYYGKAVGRSKKPWWNDNLTLIWKAQCKAERTWKRGQHHNRKVLQTAFIQARKKFDSAYQRERRRYIQHERQILTDLLKSDS
jgi:hypothetical protein